MGRITFPQGAKSSPRHGLLVSRPSTYLVNSTATLGPLHFEVFYTARWRIGNPLLFVAGLDTLGYHPPDRQSAWRPRFCRRPQYAPPVVLKPGAE